MSTYNGDKFLNEQLDSIIKQSYQNWKLFIRDDGSKDRTIEIIKEYTSIDPRIIYLSEISEENLGVKQSFLSLLLSVESRYYFFCDQDDVWLSNKIEDTIKFLKENEDEKTPICVHTDLEIVNEFLETIHPSMIDSQNLNRKDELRELIVQNSVTGCTMAINNSLKKLILKQPDVRNILMHDWWIALVASSFGKTLLLDKTTILYRQHGNNEVGAQSIISKVKKGYNLNSIVLSIVDTFVQAEELLKLYSDTLSLDKRNEIHFYLSILSDDSNLIHKVKWFRFFRKKGLMKNFMFILVNTIYNKKIKTIVKESFSE